MKRQNPISTLFGLFSTAALLAGLGIMLLVSGGKAFSPGDLSAQSLLVAPISGYTSHADFENECQLCHQPLKTTQDVLCIECHTSVGEQITSKNHTHGHVDDVNNCAACHAEHQGRQFDTLQAAFDKFDHTRTHFSLAWHQVNFDTSPMDCKACHNTDGGFSLDQSRCAVCHATRGIGFMVEHVTHFGEDCTACHDGKDSMTAFDHQETDFILLGKHAETSCDDCHGLGANRTTRGIARMTPDLFGQTSTDCVTCHEEPDGHRGMFSQNCSECHDPQAWLPARLDGQPFEHFAHSGFSLALHRNRYDGQAMICKDCHPGQIQEFDLQTCIDCHQQDPAQPEFMAGHLEKYGPACRECHDGVDRMQNFNHNTVFPLTGRHGEIDCTQCHAEQKFTGTPKECARCHEEPKVHAGFFGLQCQYCHTDQTWTPARLQIHPFPLAHGSEIESECKLCHTDRYTEYTCYGCHDHQPAAIQESHLAADIPAADIPNCTQCHPTGLKDETNP